MATSKKVKYVGPNGEERLVREGDVAADTAARFDGYRPAETKTAAKAPSSGSGEKPKA